MDNSYLMISIVIAALITFMTRAIPFIFFSKKQDSLLLKYIELYMPLSIMVILIFYVLREVNFFGDSYGLPEMIGIFVAISLHLRFKNALLSIIAATALYMIIITLY